MRFLSCLTLWFLAMGNFILTYFDNNCRIFWHTTYNNFSILFASNSKAKFNIFWKFSKGAVQMNRLAIEENFFKKHLFVLFLAYYECSSSALLPEVENDVKFLLHMESLVLFWSSFYSEFDKTTIRVLPSTPNADPTSGPH